MNILNILAWTEYSDSAVFSTSSVRLFIMLLGKIFLLLQKFFCPKFKMSKFHGWWLLAGARMLHCVAAGLEVMNILGSNPWIPGSWVLTFSSNEQKVEFVKGDISLLKVAIAIN